MSTFTVEKDLCLSIWKDGRTTLTDTQAPLGRLGGGGMGDPQQHAQKPNRRSWRTQNVQQHHRRREGVSERHGWQLASRVETEGEGFLDKPPPRQGCEVEPPCWFLHNHSPSCSPRGLDHVSLDVEAQVRDDP